MAKYVIDTNIYIHASHDDALNNQLDRFVTAFAPFLYLHSVVAFELLVGPTTTEQQKRTRQRLISRFERRNRIITPGSGAWQRAGTALAQLVASRKLSPGPGITKSLVNDCLIAASAADVGFTLITENIKDFALLDPLLPLDYTAPWPPVEPLPVRRR